MLLAGMFTVSCGIVSASAADTGTSQSAQKTITIATWANTYTSVNKMMNEADKVIIGTVEYQTVEQIDELYFTHY